MGEYPCLSHLSGQRCRKKRHMPPVGALLEHQTCWPGLACSLALPLCTISGVTCKTDSWSLGTPCSLLLPAPISMAKERPQIQAQDWQQPAGLGDCHLLVSPGTSLSPPGGWNRAHFTQGRLDSELSWPPFTNFQRTATSSLVMERLIAEILPKELTVKGATCL